jgi:hypothetical protein
LPLSLLEAACRLLADIVAEGCDYSSEAAASIPRKGSHHPLPRSAPSPCFSPFGAYIAAESEKWAKVVKFADIKPE